MFSLVQAKLAAGSLIALSAHIGPTFMHGFVPMTRRVVLRKIRPDLMVYTYHAFGYAGHVRPHSGQLEFL